MTISSSRAVRASASAPETVAAGVEAGLEELHEQARDVGVAAQRLLDVVDGERAVALLHVLGVGPQHGGLPPGQAGSEDQGVEAVDLVVAVPHRADGVLERLARVVGHAGRVAQPELVDVGRVVDVVELVGPLVDDLHPHRRQGGQHLRERDRAAPPEHLEPGLAPGGVERGEQRQVGPGLTQPLEPAEVERSGGRGEVLLVGLGERRLEGAGEPRPDVLAELGDGGGGEVVAPRARRVGQLTLEVGDVDVGDGHPARRMDHEVDACGGRLAHPDRELDGLAAEALLEDLGEALADGGVVAVAGQEDQHADVAAVGVAADEDPELSAPAGLHDTRGHGGELVDRGVEQLVARVGLEGVDEGLAGVAVGVEADDLEHRLGLLAQQRHLPHGLGVGGAGEQAEEAALADDLALVVEHLHADVVEVGGAVHGGAGVGLRQHQQGVLTRHLCDLGRQLARRRRHVGVVAQDAVARPGHTPQVVAVVVLEVVLPVAEEREVVGAQPLEEGDTLLELVGRDRGRRVGPQLVDDQPGLLAHPVPVLDGLADVAEHPLHVLGDRVDVLVVPDPADLDVHPRLPLGALGRLGGLVVGAVDLLEPARDVAGDVELGVDDQVYVALLPGQLHRDRVDQERHVVGDHLDDGVAAGRPAVLGEGRREHVDAGRALGADVGRAVVGDQRAVQLLRGAVADVVGRHVAVVGAEERSDLVVGRSAGTGAAFRESDRLGEQVGLLGVGRQAGRH